MPRHPHPNINPLSAAVAASMLLLLAGPAHAPAQGAPDAHLNEVLRQLDAASLRFHSAEADFRKDLFQRVVKETTSQTGSIYFLKASDGAQMGATFNPPEARIIEFKGGHLRLFDPGANHLTVVDAHANQAQYETFLTLGFGGSGKDLERTWTITDGGSEQMSDGDATIAVEKLDLIARDPGLRNTFTHVIIWVDPARAVSLKQQFFSPSEDIQTATYTHIRLNQPINPKRFAIKTNGKTTSS